MKKLAFLIAALAICFGSAKGDNLVYYQGEIDFGYSFGVGGDASGRVNIHTIQGIGIGKYLSTGIGTGVDFHHNFDDTSEMIVPVFVNVKGYYPLGKKITPFLSCDAGVGVGVTGTIDNNCGFHVAPGIGFVWGLLKVQAGYNLQNVKNVDLGKLSMSSIQLKVGLMF